jgi:hypothetical protein
VRKLCILFLVITLFGCRGEEAQIERCLELRKELLNCTSCSFTTEITADFGDITYTFTLLCQGNADGSLEFSVVKPETISGIRGILSAAGGKITFHEDRAVAFPLLAEGEASPISGPWLLYNTLRSGYIGACGIEGERLRATLNDTYEAQALQIDVWLDVENRPELAEILWQGRRILSLRIEDFRIV